MIRTQKWLIFKTTKIKRKKSCSAEHVEMEERAHAQKYPIHGQVGFKELSKWNHSIFVSFEPFKRLHEQCCTLLSINAESVVMPPSAVPPPGLEHKKKQMEKYTTLAGESVQPGVRGARVTNGRYTNVIWERFLCHTSSPLIAAAGAWFLWSK